MKRSKSIFVVLIVVCSMFFITKQFSDLEIVDVVQASWYDNNWSFCKKIIINHQMVSENLTNFPVLVYIISDDFSNAQSDGDDFVFVDKSNIKKYNHEIETFNSTTGELIAWVNITYLSAVNDTILYLYYGNPTCSNQQNVSGTWDSNYVAVWHMNDRNTSTISDSTVYRNNGTKKGENEPAQNVGLIGLAQSFDGINDYIEVIHNSSLSSNSQTVELFFRPATSPPYPDWKGLLFKSPDGSSMEREFGIDIHHDSGSISYAIYDGVSNAWRGYSDIFATAGSWYHVALVKQYNTNGDRFIGYVDGTLRNSVNQTWRGAKNNASVIFGRVADHHPNRYFNGTIDEVRISNSARSAGWINTTYNTIYLPSSFITVGEENISWYNASFLYRKKIVINHNRVDSYLTNFPVMVKTTMNTSKVQSNGNDILFTSSTGVKLNHEIESYNSTSGELVAWVNVTSIRSTNPSTYIYMYYGNATCSSQQNVSGTWDSNYVAVWHMNDRNTSTISDSTVYRNNGTKKGENEPAQNVGLIGLAQSFDGINDYIEVIHNSSLSSNSQTVELFFRPATSPPYPDWKGLLFKSPDGSSIAREFGIDVHMGAGNISYAIYDGVSNTWRGYSGILARAGSWYHVALVKQYNTNGDRFIGYVNGTLRNSVNQTWRGAKNTASVIFGRVANHHPDRYFNGTIDEVRISNSARSAEWISTGYKNMIDPDNFTILYPEEEYKEDNSPPYVPSNLGPVSRQIAPNVNIWAYSSDPDGGNIFVYFYDDSTDEEIGYASGESGGNFSVTWTGLNRGINYTFYAKAFDGIFWSDKSLPCTFQTNNPPYVVNVRIENSSNPLRLITYFPFISWTFSDPDDDSQTKYHVEVGTNVNGSNMWNSTEVTSSNQFTVYGGSALSRGVRYYVRVRAYDGYEWGNW